MGKYDKLIDMCKNGVLLTQENVGDEMIFVDRKTFQLIIPKEGNTDEYGDFFINSIKGHDCYSYNEGTLVYHILSGEGKFIIEDDVVMVKSGDVITIDPNKVFTYMGKMLLILEMTPNFNEKTDHFVRYVDYDKEGK